MTETIDTMQRAPKIVRRTPTVITSTEDQRRAYDRYIDDQRQIRVTKALALERRKQRPAAKLLELTVKGLGSWYTHYVDNDVRLDCVLVAWAFRAAYRAYFLGSSFVLAHALFAVGPKGYRHRRTQCNECSFAKQDAQGILRCHGHDIEKDSGGRTCDCPQVWWWLPSYLAYQIALRNFVCPIGRFGRLGPWWVATRFGCWYGRPAQMVKLSAVARQQRHGNNNTGARGAAE